MKNIKFVFLIILLGCSTFAAPGPAGLHFPDARDLYRDLSNGKSCADLLFPLRDDQVKGWVRQLGSADRMEKLEAQKQLLRVRYANNYLEQDFQTGPGTKKKIQFLKAAYAGIDWNAVEKEYAQLRSSAAAAAGAAGAVAGHGGGGAAGWRNDPRIPRRKEVFDETQRIIQANGYRHPGTGQFVSVRMNADIFSFPNSHIAGPKPGSMGKTNFQVRGTDSLDEAYRLKHLGHAPVVLDMANANFPGGSPHEGAPAQEEQMCYRSTLYPILQRFAEGKPRPYIPELGALYLPEVTVFRENETKDYTLMENPFWVAVIASPAYRAHDHPRSDAPRDIGTYERNTKEKIRTQLVLALREGHTHLVLGAWGCGAFKNKPETIARLYKEVFEEDEFKNMFQQVIFSILEPAGRKGPNTIAFERMVEELNL